MSEEPYYDAETKRSAGFEKHVKSRSTWLRLVFMILFALISSVVRLVIGIVVLVQFLQVLFTGKTNRKLLDFGHSLAAYLYEITAYLTYNTEVRPFPFDAPWPPPTPPILHPPIVAPPPPSPSPPPPPSSASPPPPTTETPPAASESPSESSSPSSSSESSQTAQPSPQSSPAPSGPSSSTGDPPL